MAKKYTKTQSARSNEQVEPVVEVSTPIEAPVRVSILTQPVKMDFDAWWAMREKSIPRQHLKEIILADIKARKLSLNETMKTYDEALGKYGVKLKS